MLHVLLAAVVALQTPPQSPPQAAPTFAQVAAEHFATWDRNTDGKLSPDEIDALCVDPKLTSTQAAAAAAMKRIVRSGKYAVPELTRDYLATPPPKPAAKPEPKAAPTGGKQEPAKAGAKEPVKEPVKEGAKEPAKKPEDQDRRDSTENPTAALKPPNFQASYASSLRKIKSTQRGLFLDDTPDLDKCRQGPLGDCYFVAAVGAFVHRDSAAIKQLIQARDDGGYEVRFADGKSITLPPLTDAELALSGTTGDEGLWLPVLEKALGALRRQADPKKYAMATATDAIAKGGSSATIVRMLTGHQTERIGLKKRARGTVPGPDGKPMPKPPLPADDLDKLAAKVRTEVGAALAGKRLVTCGTGTEKQPPGISGKHAYAVLAFDDKGDTLTVWNPHGNTYKPKGEPGLAHGYATKAGVFAIPVKDFVQVFGGVVVETDKAIEAPKPPAGKQPGKR